MDGTLIPASEAVVWLVELEQQIEEAIAQVIADIGLKKLPLLPSHQTMHLMAKAAVTVYEAAVENHDREG